MGSSRPSRRTSLGDGQRRAIVQFAREFENRKGHPPSQREIAGGVGLAISTVSYHLAILEQDGDPVPRRGDAAHDRPACRSRPAAR